MKKFIAVSLLLVVNISFGLELRLDTGFYWADEIFFGKEKKKFHELDASSSDGHVESYYLKTSLSHDINDAYKVFGSLEFASKKMFDFSAGGAKKGDRQSHLSKINFGLESVVYSTDKFQFLIKAEFEAPASSYDSFRFNSVGNQVTSYNLSASSHYQLTTLLGLYSSIGFFYRPGDIELKESSVMYSLDIPDRLFFELGLPLYFGRNVLTVNFSHIQSLGGVDIGGAAWANFASNAGQPPFPATEENISNLQISYARVFDKYMIDLSLTHQIDGRNTDKGIGANVGLTYQF